MKGPFDLPNGVVTHRLRTVTFKQLKDVVGQVL